MRENWGLVGHEWAVAMLRQHVARHAVRHAYLFAGPAGVGRRSLALRFAQALNCRHASADGLPCGTCHDCQQIERMQHPDLMLVQAESQGGVLKVDQVREARRVLTLKPYQSAYRIVLFLRFQEANDSAANALLKTLEEAPSHAVLILTADSPEQLLPTIVSRCEILRLRPLPLESVEAFLRARGLQEEPARLVAHLSGGRPGYALRLAEDPARRQFREQTLSDLQALLAAPRTEKFAYAERISQDKDALRETLLVWLTYWRDVLLRAAGASTPLTHVDRAEEVDRLAEHVGLSRARGVVSALEQALQWLEVNVNARLLIEVLLLDWPRRPDK